MLVHRGEDRMRKAFFAAAILAAFASSPGFAQKGQAQPTKPASTFTLTVTTNPKDSSIFVDGAAIQGNSIKVAPGVSHKVLVTAQGYADFNTSITLTKDTVIQANLTFTGVQLVVLANVAGAQVFLNGAPAGIAPLKVQLPPGNYSAVVRAKGYNDSTMNFTLNAPMTVSAVLQTASFDLSVDANVRGARVYVDGNLAGASPLILQVVPGVFTVDVKADGYEDYSTQVVVDSPQSVSAALAPSPEYLYVASSVKDAKVYVDGGYLGTAPAEFKVAWGPHIVEVKADGYGNFTARTDAGKRVSVRADLSALPRRLVVEGGVEGARLRLNGTDSGSLPYDALLPQGTYSILVEAPGYEDYSTIVNLSSDATIRPVFVSERGAAPQQPPGQGDAPKE
jgi:hypothetical protein